MHGACLRDFFPLSDFFPHYGGRRKPLSISGNGRPGVRSGAAPAVIATLNAVFDEAMRDPTMPTREKNITAE